MNIKKIIKVKKLHPEITNITWVINNICPNSCSYCPVSLHNGTNHNYDWQNARRFLKILFERYPKIHFSISGGEPSLSPFLPELLKIIKENNSIAGITSNAARTVDYWNKISPFLQYACFSWHPEYEDQSFDKKILAAAEHTPVTVRVMMHPKFWNRSVEKFEQLIQKDGIGVEAVRVLNWSRFSDPSASIYEQSQLEWFEKVRPKSIGKKYNKPIINLSSEFYLNTGENQILGNPSNFINLGMTNFNGYKCDIGLESLFIDYLGDIRRGNCKTGGIIGYINDPDHIQWPTDSIICDINICHCTTDVLISKKIGSINDPISSSKQ